MSGPKTPYGYDILFHNILADITIEQPEEMEIETGKHPAHLRSQFNQFRNAWLHQATAHHKKKELQEERACRDNYNRLMQYECVLLPLGILLRIRRTEAKITKRGRVATPLSLEPSDLEIDARVSDDDIRAMLRPSPSANPAPVIPDNPTEVPTSNKYGIPVDPPRK